MRDTNHMHDPARSNEHDHDDRSEKDEKGVVAWG